MLSFFRKYEKTFFLIVFLPAIIGMGVTSVIVTVLTQQTPDSPGKVFGQTVALAEWQAIVGPYAKIMRQSQENVQNEQFKFYAFTKAAEKAGIRVTDAEVRDAITREVGYNIARLRAGERIREMGLDGSTQEGQNKFRQIFFEEISHPRENVTDEDYATLLSSYGLTMQEYEGHQRRLLMQRKLGELFEESATIGPDEMWKEYKEKGQKREAELVTIDATGYVPSAGTQPTDDEVKRYYEAHKALYDEPRRVSLEYAAAPFEKTKLELGVIPEAALQDYYDKHRADFTATVGTETVTKPFADVRPQVTERLTVQLSKDRAQTLLEQVANKLDEQRKSGKVDMSAACEAVRATNAGTGALVTGKTDLLEPEEYYTHPLLTGFAAQRWAMSEPTSPTRTSDPLKGEKCVCVLRTAEVKEKKVPTFDEIKNQVRTDYLAGGERELKRYYQDNQWKYRTKDRWKVDVAFVDYEEYAKKAQGLAAPTDDEVNAFWRDQHATRWPGVADPATVGSDAIALACKAEKNKGKANDALKKLQMTCTNNFLEHKRADVAINTPVELGNETLDLDRDALEREPRFHSAATAIPIAKKEEPSEPFERSDGKGKFFFVVRDKQEQKVPELAEIKDQVAKDVLAARGYERARAAADKLQLELKDLSGDALAKALAAKGLAATKTGLFARGQTALPGIGSVAQEIITETFSSEPAGGFEHVVADDLAKKVYIVRCVRREDPAEDKMAASDKLIVRRDILRHKRYDVRSQKMLDLELRAKGISDEHVKWVRARCDGPGGRVSSKVRQIFVPNDKATLDGWLEDAARRRIEQALAQLKGDAKWEKVCIEFSEDEATRARGGEVTAVRGDLAEQYGPDFESKVFELPADGQVSVPIKSKHGLHLVKVVKAPSAGDPSEATHGLLRMTFRHILVSTDAKKRQLPPEISDKARAIAKKKIEDAKARVEKGEAFSAVAAEVGLDEDARARGETFKVDYLSTVMQKALEQPLELTAVSSVEPFEVKADGAGGAGGTGSPHAETEWHIALCVRDSADREPSFRAASYGPRAVYECVAANKDTLLAARRELEAWTKGRPDHDPTSVEVVREWKKILKKYSTAESAKKEGAFGIVKLDDGLRHWDMAAVSVLCTLDPGKRSEIVETKDGFHYMECVSAETKAPDDVARNREIAEALLHGTEWYEDSKP